MKRTAGSATRSRGGRKGSGAVGIKLVVEVLKGAPVELTSGERLLLVVLAEQAREETRECWPGMDLICEHTGLTADAVRKVLQRLAARGLEVRVAVGKDRKGRAIYAYEGASTRYRIPRFRASSGAPALPPPDDGSRDRSPATDGPEPETRSPSEAGTQSHHEGGPESRQLAGPRSHQEPGTQSAEEGPQSLRGGTVVPKRRERSTALPLSSPQFPSSSSRERDFIRAAAVVKEEEEEEFHAWIVKSYSPGAPQWWSAVDKQNDFGRLAERWRAQRTPTPPRMPHSIPRQEETDPMAEPPPDFHAARDAAREARSARPNAPSRPSFETAQTVLAQLPYAEAARWKAMAREQLPGAQQADDRAVTILAAELADAADESP